MVEESLRKRRRKSKAKSFGRALEVDVGIVRVWNENIFHLRSLH